MIIWCVVVYEYSRVDLARYLSGFCNLRCLDQLEVMLVSRSISSPFQRMIESEPFEGLEVVDMMDFAIQTTR